DDKLKSLFHGHSFTANPIACSAALASLELLQATECQKNIERIVAQQGKFCEKITGLANLKNIRQRGTIIAFEVIDEADDYTSNIRDLITQKALKNGVYLRPLGNTVYIMPPYCITPEELEKVHAVLIGILEEIN
nr:aminotransferase class III-fold pyridoxal phosphate-dependent enzyme [Chitinophagaceae bacterium]